MADKALNDRQRRFAEFVVQGMAAGRAYEAAGYDSVANVADSAAERLLRNVEIQAYLVELRRPQTKSAILSVEEKREFLARVLRTPIGDVDENDPICQEITRDYIGEESGNQILRKKVKKLDPLKAIELDSKLAGHFAATVVEVPGLSEFFASLPKEYGLPSND